MMMTIVSILLFFLVSDDIRFLNKDQFYKQINRNKITVVEFYAEWNNHNAVNDIKSLKNCDVYRVNIEEEIELKANYEINVVPTIIVFENGKEKNRYEANVMFQMCPKMFSCNKIQKDIGNIILEKFR
jgi:thiol-disulfide isomerase/thioredoxin